MRRDGAILVLAAALMVAIFGFLAFTVDTGYLTLLKSQLQSAADAAALAASAELANGPSAVRQAAKDVALSNKAGGQAVVLSDAQIELGNFDLTTKTFVPVEVAANAVRVTTRAADAPLFFAPVIGHKTATVEAQAISMLNPRDICFVVDLSGSMNDDTDACWATSAINTEFGPAGYPTVGSDLIQTIFDDFGYGTYPGLVQHVGQPLGVAQDNNAYANLTKNGGPLTLTSIPTTYRILGSDGAATRKTKAYKWLIDFQIAVIMPAAKPVPSSASAAGFAYWSAYLDYILYQTGSSAPPSQDSDRITGFNNPNGSTFPSASSSLVQAWRNKIGYVSYVQFMMDWGRDRSPDVANSTNSDPAVGTKTPLSVLSPYCPYHTETTAAGNFSFPPREQPTHASRRSLIAAIKVVQDMNSGVGASSADRVSLVTFDALDAYHQPEIKVALTNNYQTAMQACTTLQAVGDINASTATENGLILARQHLETPENGGQGRSYASKVLVLLTDGVPNLYSSSNSTISNYIADNPDADFYSSSSGNAAKNSVLMQTSMAQGKSGHVYPVGLGLGADYDFLDRVARIAETDKSGQSPRGSGNPAEYEQRLTAIFTEIIKSPGSRLVK